jgi:hypothetical protein
MATKCFTVVRGKRLRITRLDECGNPPPPLDEAAFVVTKGFITVSLSANTADGTDIEQMNADGDLCVVDRSRDQFKWWDVEIELCDVDPGLLSLMSNVNLEEDWNSDIVGIRGYQGAPEGAFALELWSGVPGTDCLPGEPTNYGYLLLPFVNPNVLGDITIENGNTTFTVSGYTRGSGGWGVGPYDVIPTDIDNTPGPLLDPMESDEHHLMRLTTIAPPDLGDCGLQAMVDYDAGEGGE